MFLRNNHPNNKWKIFYVKTYKVSTLKLIQLNFGHFCACTFMAPYLQQFSAVVLATWEKLHYIWSKFSLIFFFKYWNINANPQKFWVRNWIIFWNFLCKNKKSSKILNLIFQHKTAVSKGKMCYCASFFV